VEKDPIQFAEDVVNMRIIYKKGYVAHAVLVKAQKSENTTGLEQKIS